MSGGCGRMEKYEEREAEIRKRLSLSRKKGK